MSPVAVKLYWWKDRPNFGDAMSPAIVSHVANVNAAWAAPEDAQLYAVGSILSHSRSGRGVAFLRRFCGFTEPKPSIWGSGIVGSQLPKSFYKRIHNYKFSLVRGPLTSAILDIGSLVPCGDPGLLVSDLMPSASVGTSGQVGLVLHHNNCISIEDRVILGDAGIIIIDAGTADWLGVVKKILSCDRVLSSSLHGLIVADSFRIPNAWVDLGRIHRSFKFKFYDYFLGVGRGIHQPVVLEYDRARQWKRQIDGSVQFGCIARGLDGIKDRMRGNFPFGDFEQLPLGGSPEK